MTPYEILGYCLLVVVTVMVAAYIVGKWSLARKAAILRDAEPESSPRRIAKHPALGARYDKHGRRTMGVGRTRSIFLTAHELERVNVKRALRGAPPLNRAGFSSAVAHAHAWGNPELQPYSSSSWLTYLIMYECLLDDHTSRTVRTDIGITITPDAPYNGHGGEFADDAWLRNGS